MLGFSLLLASAHDKSIHWLCVGSQWELKSWRLLQQSGNFGVFGLLASGYHSITDPLGRILFSSRLLGVDWAVVFSTRGVHIDACHGVTPGYAFGGPPLGKFRGGNWIAGGWSVALQLVRFQLGPLSWSPPRNHYSPPLRRGCPLVNPSGGSTWMLKN